MKRLVMFMILVACVAMSGCENKLPIDNSDSHIKQVTSANIKPLREADFVVSDSIDSIKLDSPFKDFKNHKPEEKMDNNYVGETTFGEYVYKTYMHKYTDFHLYVSNLNYNLKNRSFDEYYIVQVNLTNFNFKTARGITVGSKLENVYDVYGNGESLIVDGIENLSYYFEDMQLLFTIDENKNVKEVTLMIRNEK